jgi:hypothetical protein
MHDRLAHRHRHSLQLDRNELKQVVRNGLERGRFTHEKALTE